MALFVIITLILGCALLGGYAKACILDMTDSVSRPITGIESVDAAVNLLLEFFSQGLRKNHEVKGMDLEALIAFVYLAAQFGGAWYIIALEGLRFGNKGTILSWTGTFGIVFQAVTITIIAPIYLTIQLLVSPSIPQQANFLADPTDLSFLPIATIISYVVPSIGLCLPLVFDISREAKFIAVALWQPFPLYQSALHSISRLFSGSRQHTSKNKAHVDMRLCRKALNRAYMFITGLTRAPNVIVTGIRAILLALVGGPIFPALMFLWERDDIVINKASPTSRKQK
ncbi:unnamed protein product [Fusarium langsethiae]|nr:unnamed protein product [Fusarium langsethiae]